MTATLLRPDVRSVVLECRLCGTCYPTGFVPRCEFCGGPTDVFYDLSRARVGGLDESPLRRYADLLPVADDDPRLVPTYSFGDDPLDAGHAAGPRDGAGPGVRPLPALPQGGGG